MYLAPQMVIYKDQGYNCVTAVHFTRSAATAPSLSVVDGYDIVQKWDRAKVDGVPAFALTCRLPATSSNSCYYVEAYRCKTADSCLVCGVEQNLCVCECV